MPIGFDSEQKTKARKISSSAIGGFGLKHHSGRINEEYHKALQGTRATKVYREMSDNDPIIGGILFAIKSLSRQAPHSVKAANSSKEAKEWADFLQTCIADLSYDWENFMSEVMSALVYGWAFFEVIYKVRRGKKPDPDLTSKFADGKIGWSYFGSRAQETLDHWEFDDHGRTVGFWQALPDQMLPVFIPMEKGMLFRTEIYKGNPEGRSMLRTAYRAWYIKKRLEEIEAIGIERNIAGLPVLQVPPRLLEPNPSADDAALRSELERLVQEIRMDERMGVLIPAEEDETGQKTGYKLGLLASSGKNDGAVDTAIKRWDGRIATTMLADFVTLAQDRVGAHSTFKGKANLFGIALMAFLDSVYSVINKNAVEPLLEMNGCPPELMPTIEHGDVSQAELADLASYIQALGGVGFVTPTKELENELLRRASLPLTEEGEITGDESDLPGSDSDSDSDDPEEQADQLEREPGEGAKVIPLPTKKPDKPGDQLAQPGIVASDEQSGSAASLEQDGTPSDIFTADTKVADTAFTGVQVTSMLDIVMAVADGKIPRETGVAILTVAFPITAKQASAIMGDVGRGFEPKPDPKIEAMAEAKAQIGQPPTQNGQPPEKPAPKKPIPPEVK